MPRIFLLTSVCFLTLLWPGAGNSDEDPVRGRLPRIADIMQESHQCRTAHIRLIRDQVNKADTDWEIVEKKSRELILAGKMLALNTPPKGTAADWEKRTTVYVANAVLMTDAAERKHKEDTTYHVKKLSQMCAGCHRAHR